MTLDTPLKAVILAVRTARREENGGRGFGWAQLDHFEELKGRFRDVAK